MLTLHASSGTLIPYELWQQIVVKSVQMSVTDPETSGVYCVLSGASATSEYRFSGGNVVYTGDYRFNPGQDVHVLTGGAEVSAVIVNYLSVGDGYQYEQAAQAYASGVTPSSFYVPGTYSNQKWQTTVLSGSYAKTY